MLNVKQGFTVVELLVVTSIIGVLLSISVPSLVSVRANAQTKAASRLLHVDLTRARTAALARRVPVSVCAQRPGDGPPRCELTRDWSSGWWVFVDANRNRTLDDGEPVLRGVSPVGRGLRVVQRARRPRAVRYTSLGRAWPNATFLVCPSAGDTGARRVVVYISGRTRIEPARPGDCQT